jgi:thiamine biosynthesis protein ThiI
MDVVERLARAARSRGLKLASRDFGGEINVNITRDNAFVSTNSTKGAGGLPVGSGGKAIILLSGGIDSPVAAWYAMKRGMSPVYVHFHGFPNNDAAELKKITDIADSLLRFSLRYRMYTVPASLFQLAALNAGRSETVLLKHFMLLAAERIAGLEGASMVYTGDCLGQVSSQTPQNLFAESQGIRCTIARPLIGFDKEEIIGIARRIGTYELSVLPYMDVCSINSRNPSTAVRSEVVRALAKEKKLRGIAAKSIRSAKIIEK